MVFEQYKLLGIFLSSFLSYSIIPFPAEASVLLGLEFSGPLLVFFVVLFGSTLGSITTYLIGYGGVRRFVGTGKKRERWAEKIFDRYGPISLLTLAWLPIIGDPLILLAGTLELNFWKFLVYTTVGKIIYFVLIIWFGIVLF
ncbi:DedA family protein [Candidatus Pacearchaeota archaeon]|nr:DedA family protein [Candidatus Pacearchaeota archaeon]